MDLLYQRYASPFSFIDGMLSTGRFTDFVIEFVKTINKEKEDSARWDVYLHRVFDKSYDAWCEELKTDKKNLNMSVGTIETTVTESLNILKNFNPVE